MLTYQIHISYSLQFEIEFESCFENRCWKAQTAGLRSLSLPLLLVAVQCQATSNLKSFPISSTINISGCDDDPAAKLSHWRHTKLMMANAAATTNSISKMQIFDIIDSRLIIPFQLVRHISWYLNFLSGKTRKTSIAVGWQWLRKVIND